MSATQDAARFWLHRERVEVEAASLFADLSERMALSGAPPAIRAMAAKACADELRHADRCRAIIDSLDPGAQPSVPRDRQPSQLAPLGAELTIEHQVLYGSVAIGCITETLSVALLMEIRARAQDAIVSDVAHEILRDEIEHSRIGWAALEHARTRVDVAWLEPHLATMLKLALGEELAEPAATPRDQAREPGSLEPWGVLSSEVARATCEAAVRDVIIPGLRRAGLDCSALHR
ncbi:MAG: hypothetical protein ACI9KE_005756 [Polyangiales bacterium]|jgi:hypothetical protein